MALTGARISREEFGPEYLEGSGGNSCSTVGAEGSGRAEGILRSEAERLNVSVLVVNGEAGVVLLAV